MRSLIVALSAIVCTHANAAERDAMSYPARPIRIIVPQSPGGTTDLTARLLAPPLAERFGQSVVVDNRPGAGSLVGTDLVAKAAPDGYTLLVVASSLAIMPSMYRKLPFDPVKDFAPITTLSLYPNLLLIHPSVPASNVKELIALAKAKPGSLNYASGGTGTGTQLGAELFKTMAGIDMVHVPYKGGGPAMNALMGGQVQVYFAAMPSALALVRAGKLKAMAVTSAKRSAALPELPTVAESGLPGYDEQTWNGLLGPARMPRPLVEKIKTEAHAVLKLGASRERFLAEGAEALGTEPDEFAAMIRREVVKWAKVIRQAGIKPE